MDNETPSTESQEEETDGYQGLKAVETKPVTAAFLVYIEPDGKAIATSDLRQIDALEPEREATMDDFRRACGEVAADVNVSLTANLVVNTQMRIAERMAQAQATNENIGGQLSKLVVPGR